MRERNIMIVVARCSRAKQGLGIRFERQGARQWAATWAFALKESTAKREGYDQQRMEGAFGFDPAFPGCPHCGSHGFFVCGCGKVACWNAESRTVTCPWCGATGEVGGEVNNIAAGGDR